MTLTTTETKIQDSVFQLIKEEGVEKAIGTLESLKFAILSKSLEVGLEAQQ